jgi:hypothetical protein
MTKRRQPRAYVQSLEERVAMLERLLRSVDPQIAKDNMGRNISSLETTEEYSSIERAVPNDPEPDGRDFDNSSSLVSIAVSAATTYSDNVAVNELQSEIGLISLNAAGREPHYFGPSSSFSFSRILSSALKSVAGSQATHPSHENDEPDPNIRPACSSEPLPSRSMGAMLSKTYFANIHPQYPFLHQPSFTKWEDELMTANERGDISHLYRPTIFLVFMVYPSFI